MHPKVIDVVTYNGEKDMWDLRYNILKDYVDEFIVIEFDRAFSGSVKPFYGEGVVKGDKVKYIKVTDNVWHKYMDLAKSSPNTVGAAHWKEEFCQKEYIKDCITHLKDDDIVFVGDVDEIWEPGIMGIRGKLRLKVYTYFLNNRSSEQFYGTITYPYEHIKDECLNHLRSDSPKDDHYSGWHFTSMGGYEEVKRKLENSYTRESYWTPQVEANLKTNVEGSRDFLGRGFTYWIDESEWPEYLKANKEKYKHLLR